MSLSRRRGATLTEYALLLVLFVGGAAAAARHAGVAARDSFEASAEAFGVTPERHTTTIEVSVPSADGGL